MDICPAGGMKTAELKQNAHGDRSVIQGTARQEARHFTGGAAAPAFTPCRGGLQSDPCLAIELALQASHTCAATPNEHCFRLSAASRRLQKRVSNGM